MIEAVARVRDRGSQVDMESESDDSSRLNGGAVAERWPRPSMLNGVRPNRIGDGKPRGEDISQSLSDYSDGEVMGGRLYPHLKQLVKVGMVNKGSKDDRTKRGKRAVKARREGEDEFVKI